MLEFLYKLFIGHVHKWKVLEETEVVSGRTNKPFKYIKILQCEHCGNLKNFSTEVRD